MTEIRTILKCDCCFKEGYNSSNYFGNGWEGGEIRIAEDGYNFLPILKMKNMCPSCRRYLVQWALKTIQELRDKQSGV